MALAELADQQGQQQQGGNLPQGQQQQGGDPQQAALLLRRALDEGYGRALAINRNDPEATVCGAALILFHRSVRQGLPLPRVTSTHGLPPTPPSLLPRTRRSPSYPHP